MMKVQAKPPISCILGDLACQAVKLFDEPCSNDFYCPQHLLKL